MIGSVVTRLVPDEGPTVNITGFEGLTRDEQRVLVASSVTFLAGIMQVKCTEHTRLHLSFKLTCARFSWHVVVIISWTAHVTSMIHVALLQVICNLPQLTTGTAIGGTFRKKNI